MSAMSDSHHLAWYAYRLLIVVLEVHVPRHLPALLGAGLLALALPLVGAPPASAEGTDAVLTVVHGVRGLVADVRLDDKLVLSGFAPERVTDPLTVPAGTHHLQVWPSGAAQGTPAVIDQQITLTPGEQATAGVGLDAAGKPLVTVFDDSALLASSGGTALVVRSLAESAPVKVVAGAQTITPALAVSQQQVQQVAPGTYPVTVTAGDSPAPLVPAQDVPVVAGRAVVLYLIGSQSDATLGWVAQTVRPTVEAAPLRVDTGVGPVPVAGGTGTTLLVLGLPVGLLGALALRRRVAVG